MMRSSASLMEEDVTIRCRVRRSSSTGDATNPDFCGAQEMTCAMRNWETCHKYNKNRNTKYILARAVSAPHPSRAPTPPPYDPQPQMVNQHRRIANDSSAGASFLSTSFNQHLFHHSRRKSSSILNDNATTAAVVGPELLLTPLSDIMIGSDSKHHHRHRRRNPRVLSIHGTSSPPSSLQFLNGQRIEPSTAGSAGGQYEEVGTNDNHFDHSFSIPIIDLMMVNTAATLSSTCLRSRPIHPGPIILTTFSLGLLEFQCSNQNGHDILMAFLEASVAPERIMHSHRLNNNNDGSSSSSSYSLRRVTEVNVKRPANADNHQSKSATNQLEEMRDPNEMDESGHLTFLGLCRFESLRLFTKESDALPAILPSNSSVTSCLDVDAFTAAHLYKQANNRNDDEAWSETMSRNVSRVAHCLGEMAQSSTLPQLSSSSSSSWLCCSDVTWCWDRRDDDNYHVNSYNYHVHNNNSHFFDDDQQHTLYHRQLQEHCPAGRLFPLSPQRSSSATMNHNDASRCSKTTSSSVTHSSPPSNPLAPQHSKDRDDDPESLLPSDKKVSMDDVVPSLPLNSSRHLEQEELTRKSSC